MVVLDDVIRKHMFSRYMIGLYQEKKSVLGEEALTDTEKDNYIYCCSLRNSTAEIIYVFYRQLINKVGFTKLPPLAMDMLKSCQEGYKLEHNNESIGLEELYNNPTYKSADYYQRLSDFGLMEISDMKKLFENGSGDYWMKKIDEYKDDAYMNILGCKRSEASDTLISEVCNYWKLPEEVCANYINKIFSCWRLHSTSKSIGVVCDSEYSKMKYPDYDASKLVDYKKLLDSVGIEMGEMPKTFVSEIYGDSQKHAR